MGEGAGSGKRGGAGVMGEWAGFEKRGGAGIMGYVVQSTTPCTDVSFRKKTVHEYCLDFVGACAAGMNGSCLLKTMIVLFPFFSSFFHKHFLSVP